MKESKGFVYLNGVPLEVRVSYTIVFGAIKINELAFLTEDDNGHELVNNADYLLSSTGVYSSLVELIRAEVE